MPIKEKVTRYITKWTREKGLHEEAQEQPGGFMVYFPRGHALRMTDKELVRHKLNKRAKLIVDMSQLYDPESAIGKVFLAQTENERASSWKDLERQVVALATVRTGNQLLTKIQPPTEREEAL
jgi:hypothetical protein